MTQIHQKIRIDECNKELPVWRQRVISTAEGMGFSEQDAKDIALAVFEACANAIHHGSKDGVGEVTLCVKQHADRFEATIEDSGTGLTCPVSAQMPPPSSTRGRGIPLMKAVMDDVRFESAGGCKVTLTKYLKRKTAVPAT